MPTTRYLASSLPNRHLKAWHGQESFWREAYARTFATLAAALVIVLVGIVAGAITVHRHQVLRVGGLFVLVVIVAVGSNLTFDRFLRAMERRGVRRWSGPYVLYEVCYVIVGAAVYGGVGFLISLVIRALD